MCNDYYNKQIFDAVEHINMPDALGTRCYIYRSNELCGIYIVIWIKAGVQKCSLKKYGMQFFFPPVLASMDMHLSQVYIERQLYYYCRICSPWNL